MFVYGIRCSPNDLLDLPSDATADYYLDYGLLVFPAYTRPSAITNNGCRLTADFWQRARLLLQHPAHTHLVSTLEHPWITEGESAVVAAMREFYPDIKTEWYYVPRTATQGSGLSSEDD